MVAEMATLAGHITDLAPLMQAGRAFAQRVLDKDWEFYNLARALRQEDAVRGWEDEIATLAGNETLLRIGAGAGMASKTPFGITRNASNPDYLRSQRHALKNGRPDLPFGWVKCTVSRRARGDELS